MCDAEPKARQSYYAHNLSVSHRPYATMRRDDRRKSGLEYLGYLRLYQHPPTISYGEAKWKRKKGMDGETRKNLGKRCKRRTMHLTINRKRTKKWKTKRREAFNQEIVSRVVPPKEQEAIEQ